MRPGCRAHTSSGSSRTACSRAEVSASGRTSPRGGAWFDVPDAQPDDLQPEAIPLDIVYQDDDVIVIDKPAGLVTHPSPGHSGGTLANALLALDGGPGGLGTIAGVQRPGIVHRLDRDTSGLLMVARNDAAQASLQAQLKARRIRKTYLGLVGGVVEAQLGRIEKPIGRDPANASPDGRDG
jgi:23S rRNA pseudouridine1911/1915/1917 synthase